MKPSMIGLVVVGILLFMGVVVWSTVRGAEVECEVCLVFDGDETCRLGRGASEAEGRLPPPTRAHAEEIPREWPRVSPV